MTTGVGSRGTLFAARSLGEGLRLLQLRSGMSAEALAKTVGVSSGSLSNYMTGTSMPSARVLRKIAGALSEPLDVDAEKLWVELGELLAETRSADAEDPSIRAYILVDATATLPLEEEIARIPGVVSVTQVQGPHDLIVLVERKTLRLMSKVVDRIHKVKGVKRTTTCISLPE